MRYPFASLLDALGCDETTVKARLGLDHRQVARYVSRGLTERRADELAVANGLHPFTVWPEMTEAVIAEEALRAEARRLAYNKRKAAAERARYHNSPARRAQALENARRYHAEHKDYLNAVRRRRRAA